MAKSFHVVRGSKSGRRSNVGQALVNAVAQCVSEGRNPGKVGHYVLTHEARFNRSVEFNKKAA